MLPGKHGRVYVLGSAASSPHIKDGIDASGEPRTALSYGCKCWVRWPVPAGLGRAALPPVPSAPIQPDRPRTKKLAMLTEELEGQPATAAATAALCRNLNVVN